MARKAEVIFVGDAASLVRAALASKAAIKSVQDQAGSGSSDLNKFEKATQGATNALSSLPQAGGAVTTTLIAAAPAAMGLVGALGAVTASAGAAVAGLGALAVGGVGALAAGLGSIALVAKPAIASFGAVTTALDAYNTAVDQYGAKSKQAATAQAHLNAVVKQNGGAPILAAAKAWDALGNSFKKLTGPATSSLFKIFNDALGMMRSLLPAVAGVANRSMAALRSAFGSVGLSSGTLASIIRTLGNTFSKIITPLVQAASLVFLGFSRIAEQASPFVVRFAYSIQTLAAKFANATKDPKRLHEIIGTLIANFTSWVKLLGAVGRLVVDVFKGGVSSGKGLVDSLTKIVNKWSEWARSAKGSKDISKFFHESAQFAKELFSALGPVVKALTVMSVGPLPIYVKLMGDLKGLLGPLTYAFVIYKVALVAATIATGIATGVSKAYAGAIKLIAAAQIAWDIAMSPIGVLLAGAAIVIGTVLVAVAALAFGIYELVTHWKAVWHAIVDATKAAVGWVKGAANDFVKWIVGAWKWVEKNTTAVWNAIKNAIIGALKDAISWVRGAVRDAGNWLSTAWHNIERTASNVWGDIGGAITGAIRDAIKWVKGAIHSVTGWLSGAWHTITKGVEGFATDIKNGVVRAFTGAVNLVIGFINDIISAIDLIPGVNIHKIKPLSTGGSGAGHSQGGANSGPGGSGGLGRRATGGTLVDHPMFMVGEEAPKHPEYVIATNPAYRRRNLGLWAEAGRKIGVPGFAQGGKFVSSAYGPPWGGIQGNGVTATGIDLSASPHDYIIAVDPSVIPLHSKVKINPNPFNFSGAFSAEDTGGAIKGNRIDFYDWKGRADQNAWGMRSVTASVGGHGGGILSALGGALSSASGFVGGILGKMLSGGASAITSLLPGVGSLPKWLRGMGSSVLGDVTRWIKHKVSGVISSLFGGGGGGGPQGTVPAAGGPASKVQAKMFAAASSIVGDQYLWGGGHGSFISPGYDCSGAVSYVLHAANLLSSPETTAGLASYGLPGRGKYITIGVSNGGPGGGHTMMNMFGRYFESGGGSGKGVHWDSGWSQSFQGYRHPAGYKMGGIPRASGGPVLPGYVYRVGEEGPEDVAFGRPGTVMTASQTRRGGGGGIHIEKAYFTGSRAAKATVDRLAFRALIGTA